MHIKRILVRIFFSVEMLIFCWVYMCGSNSISSLVALQTDNRSLQEQLHTREQEIAQLEHEIVQWESQPFYKEKVAREQLQMARAHEHVYYRVE